jgi:hypothetical protein
MFQAKTPHWQPFDLSKPIWLSQREWPLAESKPARRSPGFTPGAYTTQVSTVLVRAAPLPSPVEPPDQLTADGLHEFLAVH